jgi:Domain of unknown function (DUF4136)
MMFKYIKPACLVLSAGMILLGLGSCKKNVINNLTTDETRIYISNYDTTANFASYKTFSIDDSADVIENGQALGRIAGPFEDSVINNVVQLMQQRGYKFVNKADSPDLAMNISEITNTETELFDYSDYWDAYGSYYDPYYWGYPGFGYYPTSYFVGGYTIQEGGLELDLLDLKNAVSLGNKIQIIWTGLSRGEGVFSDKSAPGAVAALFSQSPYIKTN